jgi:hypothetical protein
MGESFILEKYWKFSAMKYCPYYITVEGCAATQNCYGVCPQENLEKLEAISCILSAFLDISSSLCLNFFHLLAWKPNLEKYSIESNKLFPNFHLSEFSFTCHDLWASVLARRLQALRKHQFFCASFCDFFILNHYWWGLGNKRKQVYWFLPLRQWDIDMRNCHIIWNWESV